VFGFTPESMFTFTQEFRSPSKACLKTVSGGTLIAMMKGSMIQLNDEKGSVATVTIANVMQSNGVIHVIYTVVQPK
jgi:uncharacterized surface protein with fasciclin (FAS1) repeats